ncbi:glycosyltransferase family 4 protein [Pelagibius sp. 7325]|uniref:glycosyltransferase family 4 protein n=1 Tax=Pelagibius sp. 7325 TaxID=3131994 RepID=UPI0030EBDBEE
MTRVLYLSPSTLPSRTANSVHVAHQCDGFSRLGAEVTLVAKRTLADAAALPAAVREAYGVAFDRVRLETFFRKATRGDTVAIALKSLAVAARQEPPPDVVLSRNLYAAYALAVLRGRQLVYEVHDLEHGVRRRLQRAIIAHPRVLTLTISEKLREILTEHHGIAPANALVLHDAAPEGITPLAAAEKRAALQDVTPGVDLSRYRTVCGYFGHLYPGRGIEVIEGMARLRPETGFLVFGGNEGDIVARRDANCLPNLHFMGFVPHAMAQRAMAACDVLLMPYQRQVSIGVAGRDTARWMSPMKMFEYLASGTPLISSDLPVLREVLRHGENALLVTPAVVDDWVAALDRLCASPSLARSLGAAGHADYAEHHTWTVRAKRILEAAGA